MNTIDAFIRRNTGAHSLSQSYGVTMRRQPSTNWEEEPHQTPDRSWISPSLQANITQGDVKAPLQMSTQEVGCVLGAGEVTAVIARSERLFLGGRLLSSLKVTCCKHSPEKWPRWREVKTLHSLPTQQEHVGMCRAHGGMPLSPVSNSHYFNVWLSYYTYF